MSSFMDSLANEVVRQSSQATASAPIPGGFWNRMGGGAKWRGGLSNSGAGTYIDHTEARLNARNAMQDSSLARAMVERMADTVVDTGLRLELTPDFNILGISREEAEKWAADVGARFHLYASDKKQHREGTLTFYQYQRMYQIWTQRDNDTFTRLYYDRQSKNLQNPLQFGAIDPDQIRGDALTTTYGFQGGEDGITRDQRGREVSYKIWMRKADGTYREIEIKAFAPGGRPLMLHGFRPEYAGQGRGFSRIAHAIQDFENITDFSSAAIKKAINQSQFVGFVEPSNDEDAVNPFEGILTEQGAGPAAETFGAVPSATVVADLHPGTNACYELPEATNDVPGSAFITNLTKGSTIKFVPNTAPADSFDSFVDSFAGYLSAATSTPLEVVLMKFGSNYSASRATLLLFWRVACGWRAEQAADMMDPIVEAWLSEEIGAGRITAMGWSDPRLKAAWLSKNWIGAPAPDIDPSKTAKARQANAEMGITNLDREAKDLNGSSAESNIEKNNRLFKSMVAPTWSKGAQQAAAPTNGSVKAMLEEVLENLTGDD